MKRIYMILLILAAVVHAGAQQETCSCSSAANYSVWLQEGLMAKEYTNPVKGYEGTQYLRDWLYGELELKNGDTISNIILRYDRYMDELLWLRKGDYRKGVINKENITGFKLIDEFAHQEMAFTKRKILLPWIDSTEVFLQVMVTGKISYHVYRKLKEEAVEFRLIDNTRHIISFEGKDYVVSLRRSSILDLPFISKAEFKRILRKNHLVIKDNEQALALAIYNYNLL